MSEPVAWACASCGERNITEPHRCRVNVKPVADSTFVANEPVDEAPTRNDLDNLLGNLLEWMAGPQSYNEWIVKRGIAIQAVQAIRSVLGNTAPSPSPPTSGVGCTKHGSTDPAHACDSWPTSGLGGEAAASVRLDKGSRTTKMVEESVDVPGWLEARAKMIRLQSTSDSGWPEEIRREMRIEARAFEQAAAAWRKEFGRNNAPINQRESK